MSHRTENIANWSAISVLPVSFSAVTLDLTLENIGHCGHPRAYTEVCCATWPSRDAGVRDGRAVGNGRQGEGFGWAACTSHLAVNVRDKISDCPSASLTHSPLYELPYATADVWGCDKSLEILQSEVDGIGKEAGVEANV